MPTQQDVSDHYTHGNLAAAIRSGIESLGKTIDSVTIDDLAAIDEFHIGGRQASEDFLAQTRPLSRKAGARRWMWAWGHRTFCRQPVWVSGDWN